MARESADPRRATTASPASEEHSTPGWQPSALVALTGLMLYLALAPNVSGDGDGSEFTLVLATNGVAHPTGYPLYTLGGHLFVRLLHALGIGWAHAANAWSACGAALALYFLHRLAGELLPAAPAGAPRGERIARAVARGVPLLLFALNPIWTNEAMLAEVYGWHLAWVGGAAWTFARLARRIEAGHPHPARLAWLWGLIGGLGVANHLTSVLVSLPLTLALGVALGRRGRLGVATIGAALAGAVPPLLAYGFIAWRAGHPAPYQWAQLEPGGAALWEHVSGGPYRHFLGYFAPSPEHVTLLTRAGYPILAAGLLALLAAAVRTRGSGEHMVRLGLAGAALLVTLYGFNYGVPDPAPYFLPALALGLAGLGPVLLRTWHAAGTASGGRWLVGAAGLGGLVALLFFWSGMTLERRRNVLGLDPLIRTMWAAVPDRPAIVFWPDDRYLRLREYQLLRGEKPSLDIQNPEVLLNDLVRRRFMARHGVDPLRGLALPTLTPGAAGNDAAITRFLVRVIRNVAAQSPLPVILFDPSGPSVREVAKSGERP